jgi:hypothetical protein
MITLTVWDIDVTREERNVFESYLHISTSELPLVTAYLYVYSEKSSEQKNALKCFLIFCNLVLAFCIFVLQTQNMATF